MISYNSTLTNQTKITMKIKFLWMAAFCVAFLSACSDDDDKKKTLSKAYSLDGEEVKITTASFDPDDLANGNYDLEFWSDEDQDYINIQLSGEWDGQEVDLSEADDDFDWSWYVYFEQNEGESWVEIVDGFGSDESQFGNVEGGELYIKLVDEEDHIFDVRLSVTTTEGKEFKLKYKGVFTPEAGGAARTKKQ